MRLIDADHLKNKLGAWWDKQDEVFAEMIDECPTINTQEPCDDVISRQAVLELTWEEPSYTDALNVLTEIRDKVKALPSVTPTHICVENTLGALDCISRDMALEKMADYVASGYADSAEDFEEYSRIICQLPSVNPQELKTEQFAKWVASEIFDEMWEYNKDAFAEIACRKLAKLGIVRAKGDEWELVEPQESEG